MPAILGPGVSAAVMPKNAKPPTLQDVTKRLRALLAEAGRSEEFSEGLMSRMLGPDLSNAIAPPEDGPSNGFISDTIEIIDQAYGALERSNANMRRLQDALMVQGIEAAE